MLRNHCHRLALSARLVAALLAALPIASHQRAHAQASGDPTAAAHTHAAERAIEFPDTPDYLSLTCDFHTHTVFSDGSVWPTIRVQEALRDNLDCIAITEHIEYQPHRDDIPHPDRNRAFDIATRAAANSELIVLLGSEITRSMPPGHSNAIFLTNANALLVDDVRAAFEAAGSQGAFTFWNHPNWTAQRKDGIARLEPLHESLIADGLLSGIEVVNEHTYSREALQIALDHDLAIIGTSDVHGIVDWDYHVPEGGHRPVTIVLAAARSAEGIRQALAERRTVVWHRNMLIGREAHVMPVVHASIRVTRAYYPGDTSVLRVEIENVSDAEFVLRNTSPYSFHKQGDLIMLPPHHTTVLDVKTLELLTGVRMTFEMLSVITAPGTHPVLELRVPVGE
ncbi:MAG: PHP domain-containing protein [Bacteroidetes bacterium CG12_big_fil_rev_8_21_14_0_65_60_17]|nr:MAG: PHP domain-containing protein [Bacteroidetes bacterium CG12_big_fil_rev_8_21_14_0_65_60_17]